MFPDLEKTTVINLKTWREGTGTIKTNLKGFQQNPKGLDEKLQHDG